MSSHSPILGAVANWILSDPEGSVYNENGKYHISSTYFTQVDNRASIVSWVSSLTDRMETASLIGVSQGFDHGSQMIATWVGTELQKPSFAITEGELDEGPPSNVRSNLSNCALVLCYTSYGQQVLDILNNIERLGGNAVQVITLTDERHEAEEICKRKKVQFHSLMYTSDVIKALEGLQNANLTHVNAIVKLLNQA